MADDTNKSFFDKLIANIESAKADRQVLDEKEDFEEELSSRVSKIERSIKTLHANDIKKLKDMSFKVSEVEKKVSSIQTNQSRVRQLTREKYSDLQKDQSKAKTSIDSLEERLKRSEQTELYDYSAWLKKLKKSQSKMEKGISTCFNKDKMKDIGDKRAQWIISTGSRILKGIGFFMLNTVKNGLVALDNLASIMTFGFWDELKSTLSLGKLAVDWFMKTGKRQISTIGTAMKNLFGFEFGFISQTIKKSVSLIGGGIKFIGKWIAGLLGNLLSPPGLFLYGIPILIVFGPTIFKSVTTFLTKKGAELWNMIDSYLNLSEIWNDIIYPTFNRFWSWMTGEKFPIWWEKVKPIIGQGIYDFFSVVLGEERLKKFIKFAVDSWQWVQMGWTEIKTSYATLQSISKIILSVKLTMLIAKTGSFLAKVGNALTSIAKGIGKFIARLSGKVISMVSNIASRVASRIGASLTKYLPRLTGFIKTVMGPLTKIIPRLFTFLSVGSKILGRLIPGVGWVLTAIDVLRVGYYTFRALEADRVNKMVTIKNVERTSSFMDELALQSGMSIEELREGRIDYYQNLGISEGDAFFRTEEEVRTAQLRSAAAYLGSNFDAIVKSTQTDSGATQPEWDIANKLSREFNWLYDLINNAYAEGDNISVEDLKYYETEGRRLLKLAESEWVKLQQLGASGVDSNWYDSSMRSNISRGIGGFGTILNKYSTYVMKREQSEKLFREQAAEAEEKGVISDFGAHQLNNAAISIYDRFRKQATQHMSETEREAASDKLLKAIHIAVSNGPSAMPYIKAGLNNFAKGDKAFVQTALRAAQAAEIYWDSREGKKIFIPDNFTEADINKFAYGGIIVPNIHRDNVIPLNSEAQGFIREKIEKLDLPEIKKAKESQKNITIIEENTTIQESYQIYTLKKLAKGVIGVRNG